MYGLWQDFRYGVRMLLKTPAFTVVAVLSLALGIGANTAIFQLLDAVRLKTLPVKDPQQLVQVEIADMTGARGSFTTNYPPVSNPIWEQIRDREQAFSGIFAWGQRTLNLAPGGEARFVKALWVSGDFFNVLSVQPELGRLLNPTDDTRGCATPGVVLSHAFWQREYGGQNNVIGQKLTVSDHSFEIIGVSPANFFGLEVGRTFDVALPICSEAIVAGKDSRLDSGTTWWLMVTGRLKPGWSLEQANANLQSISPDLFRSTLPANYPQVSVKDYLGFKLKALPSGTGYSSLRENYEQPLWLLLAIAGLVLLIACANLANLLLARASAREREMAVRQAVGASRLRLIRQLLIESLLLAVVGSALGALLAQALSNSLVSFLSTRGDPLFLDLSFDWRLLGFAAAVAALTCVLFGLTPALRATRIEPGAAMKASGRGLTAGRERFSLRRGLVVLQVALSLVLVTGAFLFTRSLDKLQKVDTGFRPEGVLITQSGFARLNLQPDQRLALRGEILDRIKAIPGVEEAAEAVLVPLGGNSTSNKVWLDGSDASQKLETAFSWVGPNYFKTLQTPLLAGRDFNDHDVRGAPKVALVNETFARRLLNGANPVGKRFWIETTPNDPETLYEIVGLVKDSKYGDLRETTLPVAYLSNAQYPRPGTGGLFLIRSALPQAEITAAVRQAVVNVNPAINISFQGFKTLIDESILRDRLMARLSFFFGFLALVLASIGLYGILSYGVASRTNEIGIRMALGARSRNVFSLILGEALLLVLIGVLVGLPVVFAVTRFASTLLFGLTPTDPVALSLAGLLMLAVAMAASYLPARRATKVDPLKALRYE
ncbi:MAG TPA: ABC transporter permease [Pyrinomonadaceae bacterium]|nr:ABC transporter permease [Pyrinomonadaceae bacterium]